MTKSKVPGKVPSQQPFNVKPIPGKKKNRLPRGVKPKTKEQK